MTVLISYPAGKKGKYIIPNSVTSIAMDAFGGCKSLTSIEIPNSVTRIGSSAFECCSSLTSIEIPNSVTSIGDYAFYLCSGLASVTISNNVTRISNSAFDYCSNLTSIEIPYSVTSIGENAFASCTSLTSITIPSSVTNIGDRAFGGCTSLVVKVSERFRGEEQRLGLETCKEVVYSSSNKSNHYDDSSTKWEEFAGTTYRASQWVSDRMQYYAFSYNRSGKGKYFIYCNYPGTNVVEDQMEFSIYKVESEGNYLYLYSHELNSPVKIEIQGSSLYTMNGDRYEIWR